MLDLKTNKSGFSPIQDRVNTSQKSFFWNPTTNSYLCGMKLETFEDNRILDQLNFQFQLIENRVITMQKELELQKAAYSDLDTHFQALKDSFSRQGEELKNLRQENKILRLENKRMTENEVSLKEKLNNFKQLSIIVKNPKNANAISELNSRLDEYIRYIDETMALLETL